MCFKVSVKMRKQNSLYLLLLVVFDLGRRKERKRIRYRLMGRTCLRFIHKLLII
jgi:hypothetical protein